MKKTRILSVVALTSLMAACSNEDVAVLDNNGLKQDLNIRPLVENTTIADGENLDSRLEVTGKYRPNFVDGDKLGAVLIDEPVYTSQTAYATAKRGGTPTIELYNVVEKMYSNYPYERVDGAWYTQAALVEGNYMFYAPFNEANSSVRSNPIVKLPVKQTVTSKTSAIDEFAASGDIVKVGYAFMDASGSMKPSVAMHDVFAYPLITLKNNFKGYLFGTRSSAATTAEVPTLYEGAITVDSIQIFVANSGNIKSTADDVVEAALMYGDGTSNTFADDMTKGLIYSLRDTDGANTNPWYVNAYNSAFTDDVLGTSEQSTRKILTTLVVGKTIAKGASETFNVVLPAREYGEDLSARVIVTIGSKQYQINNVALTNTSWTAASPKLVGTATDASHSFTNDSKSVTLVKAQQYPAQEYTAEGAEKANVVGQSLTIDLVGGELRGYATAQNSTDITPATVQAGFEWDPAAPTAVGISTNAELLSWFNNTTRGAEYKQVSGTPSTSLEFNLLDENSIEIKAELVEGLYTANYINNTVTGKFEFTSVLPIAKDVKIEAVTVSGSKADVKFVSLTTPTKFYVITIPVATATATINTNGNYVLGTTPVTVVNSGVTTNPLKVVNIINPTGVTASINLSTIADAQYITSLNNLGTLTINDMNGAALRIINSGTLTLAAGKKTNAEILNLSTFINNGAMMTNGINNGTITPSATSTTKINSGIGTIVNNNLGTVTVTGGTQTVTYTVSGNFIAQQTTIVAATGINKLIVTGDVTASEAKVLTKPLKNCAVTEIEIQGGDLTTNFDEANLSAVTLNFTNASTWTGKTTGTTITDCKLKSNATITLVDVNATGSFTGNGEVDPTGWSSWTKK